MAGKGDLLERCAAHAAEKGDSQRLLHRGTHPQHLLTNRSIDGTGGASYHSIANPKLVVVEYLSRHDK